MSEVASYFHSSVTKLRNINLETSVTKPADFPCCWLCLIERHCSASNIAIFCLKLRNATAVTLNAAQLHLLERPVKEPALSVETEELVKVVRGKRYAQACSIHPAIVAGRIRRERDDYRIFGYLLGRGQVRRLFLTRAA